MDDKTELYQKIFNVMSAIDYLKKDDHVKFGQQNYKAISEEKVTTTVRAELIKNKLIVLPIEQDHKREGTISTVDTKYKIIDIESGQYEIIVSSGTGADTQDKGVGKAMTYAFKYLFLRSFAIPTGEDPDKVSSAELDEKQKKQAEEREKKLNSVLIKWQTLSEEKDKAKSTEQFKEWLKKKSTTYETVDIESLSNFERTFTKKLNEKAQEKKGA
ncbi:ERF family protein [Chengkuizengella sp. SCS-71B]|uniref:ERF family protein n=1 Tax=Chengkuizengella sp. SCS-71B TaxID=3115290 RepID=UPI0032C247BC